MAKREELGLNDNFFVRYFKYMAGVIRGDFGKSYRTNLQVVSKDRPNLLVDISTILSSAKVHVSSLNARSTADGFALISLAVDVSDSQQLQAVMRRLEQISGVMRVTRPAG